MSADPPRRPRSFDRRSVYRFVRQVRGKTGIWVWQARVWFDLVVQHVHLGCHHTERAAKSAVDWWIRSGADPCRGLPPRVLPKWVRRRADGRFDAELRDRAGTRTLVPGGPFASAEAAHLAARELVARELEARRALAERPPELPRPSRPGTQPGNAPPGRGE